MKFQDLMLLDLNRSANSTTEWTSSTVQHFSIFFFFTQEAALSQGYQPQYLPTHEADSWITSVFLVQWRRLEFRQSSLSGYLHWGQGLVELKGLTSDWGTDILCCALPTTVSSFRFDTSFRYSLPLSKYLHYLITLAWRITGHISNYSWNVL